MRDRLILIRSGPGAGTVPLDRVVPGIGYMAEDIVLIGKSADAANRAIAVKLIFTSGGDMGLLTPRDPITLGLIGPFQRAYRAGVAAPCRRRVSCSLGEKPGG